MIQNTQIQNISHKQTEKIQPVEGVPTFLSKTYDILENPNYFDIISWTKNGQGFIVKKVKQFSDKILPLHFRHSNYSSFVRQLNMYDFHKMRQDNQQNGFKNILFKRGNRHMLREIQRKDYKKNKEVKSSSLLGMEGTNAKQKRSEQNNIQKQIEKQLYDNLRFTQQMKKKYEQMLKTIGQELSQLQNLQDYQKLNKNQPNSIFQIIDHLFLLKKNNNRLALQIQTYSKKQLNYTAQKLNQWTILTRHHKSNHQNLLKSNHPTLVSENDKIKHINNMPTWASSNVSFVYSNDGIANIGGSMIS